MLDKKKYEEVKKKVESDLRNYPFWLIAIEASGLGYPTRWGINNSTGAFKSGSHVEQSMLEDIERKGKVDVITRVLSKLDNKSKAIIEEWYFRDTANREDILKELNIDKNKFYYFRNRSLKKFMVALGYI